MSVLCAQDPPRDLPLPESADWLFSSVMGVVEGLTEFLPVSSTGHLIVTAKFFDRHDSTFEIAIQLGAISAILFLYWGRVFEAVKTMFHRRPAAPAGSESAGNQAAGQVNLMWLIAAAALPPAVLGILFEKQIAALLFNNVTVGITLVAGGVLFLVLESWQKRRGITEETAIPGAAMTLRQAFVVGLFQTLALIPGTSRSGATIVGGMVLGFRRTAAAEFSFLVGLPTLYGASLLKLAKNTSVLTDNARLAEFVVAGVISFISAALVVKPFVRFLQRHTFVPFAWYRIVAGSVLLVLVATGFFE